VNCSAIALISRHPGDPVLRIIFAVAYLFPTSPPFCDLTQEIRMRGLRRQPLFEKVQQMRLKIFSCHHLRPAFTCNSEIFQTLVSNLPEPEDGSFISDLHGENIAGDNLYAELRHQFYVWKNLSDAYDYIGFEHYRRPFFIDPLAAADLGRRFPALLNMRLYFAAYNVAGLRRNSADFEQCLEMRRSLDVASIACVKSWIGSYDIVVPKANAENIEEQWKQFHDDFCWDILVDAVKENRLFETHPNYIFFQLHRSYYANMYIMRTELLDEYLTFCFQVLALCRARAALSGRALGYFSERVFSFWLYQKRIDHPTLRVLELPFLFHDTALDAAAVTAALASA